MSKKAYWVIVLLIMALLALNTKNILKIIYPIQYKDYVYKYSKEYNLDPYLVFAVIKTESKFFPYARSRTDAKGLMQISKGTQKWATKNIELDNNNIFDPKTNIKIGCWYLHKLFDQFDDIDLVIAAYNGGSGNVDKWLKDDRYSYNGINLTLIPFKETRNYVDKVKKSYEMYKMIYEKRRNK